MKSLNEIVNNAFNSPRYEPVERPFAGMGKQYVPHRFPIKGGISLREVWVRSMFKPSRLWEVLERDLTKT